MSKYPPSDNVQDKGGDSSNSRTRLLPILCSLLCTAVLLAMSTLTRAQDGQEVYKWIDANGRVHYGSAKPADATELETLEIVPSSPSDATTSNALAEIARINDVSEQMAQERRALEKERQERELQRLKVQNEVLQNALLNQQLQQRRQDRRSGEIYYPDYPYYPLPSPCSFPPCYKPIHPIKPVHPIRPKPRLPRARSNPPFRPAPVGISRRH